MTRWTFRSIDALLIGAAAGLATALLLHFFGKTVTYPLAYAGGVGGAFFVIAMLIGWRRGADTIDGVFIGPVLRLSFATICAGCIAGLLMPERLGGGKGPDGGKKQDKEAYVPGFVGCETRKPVLTNLLDEAERLLEAGTLDSALFSKVRIKGVAFQSNCAAHAELIKRFETFMQQQEDNGTKLAGVGLTEDEEKLVDSLTDGVPAPISVEVVPDPPTDRGNAGDKGFDGGPQSTIVVTLLPRAPSEDSEPDQPGSGESKRRIRITRQNANTVLEQVLRILSIGFAFNTSITHVQVMEAAREAAAAGNGKAIEGLLSTLDEQSRNRVVEALTEMGFVLHGIDTTLGEAMALYHSKQSPEIVVCLGAAGQSGVVEMLVTTDQQDTAIRARSNDPSAFDKEVYDCLDKMLGVRAGKAKEIYDKQKQG